MLQRRRQPPSILSTKTGAPMTRSSTGAILGHRPRQHLTHLNHTDDVAAFINSTGYRVCPPASASPHLPDGGSLRNHIHPRRRDHRVLHVMIRKVDDPLQIGTDNSLGSAPEEAEWATMCSRSLAVAEIARRHGRAGSGPARSSRFDAPSKNGIAQPNTGQIERGRAAEPYRGLIRRRNDELLRDELAKQHLHQGGGTPGRSPCPAPGRFPRALLRQAESRSPRRSTARPRSRPADRSP